MNTPHLDAETNFNLLGLNPYPGRGFVVGLDVGGTHAIQIYWLTGRSENSRNRILKIDSWGRVFTDAHDTSKVTDPSLIIYDAMLERGHVFAVSNGHQTRDAAAVVDGRALSQALEPWTYEPDAPNFTPRITSVMRLGSPVRYEIAITRRSMLSEAREDVLYRYVAHKGFGHCVTTYAGDGNPLPAFRGDPMLMPLKGSMSALANTYWDALNKQNRVALIVKFIHRITGESETCIINAQH